MIGRGVLLVLGPLMAVAACGSSSSTTAAGGGGGNAAAGGTADSASSAAAVNVCTLLTKDQVAAAMGRPTSDGKAGNGGGIPACVWGAADPSNFSTVTVSVDASPASFDAARKLNGQSGVQVRPVADLGEDAFYFGSGEGAILEVKTAKGVLSVGVSRRGGSPTSAQQDVAEKTLAMQALTHL